MPKIKAKSLIKALCTVLCIMITVGAPVIAFASNKADNKSESQITVLNVWQIDSFEGGKGSRASFLQKTADKFSEKNNCYLTVTSLSADAARMNLNNGTVPDVISYGAGVYGFESYLKGKTPYRKWCNGGYCLLTLGENADFGDITAQNTVVNAGVGNLVDVAVALEGLNGVQKDNPTGAYVKLINGGFKYLLGTQRDVFRLKTRGVQFSVKPVESFNDLYQLISVTSQSPEKTVYATAFIDYLIQAGDVSALGLMCEGKKLYSDELKVMEGVDYRYKLSSPVSEQTRRELENAAANCDENKLKTLLKSLK